MSAVFHNKRAYRDIAGRALAEGGRTDPHGEGHASVIGWELSGKRYDGSHARNTCEQPVYVEVSTASTVNQFATAARVRTDRHTTEMYVRCRKCAACRRARAGFWRLLAKRELERSARTWFGTLTLAPDQHFQMLCRARLRLARKAIRFGELSPDRQFLEVASEAGKEITRWLKRVRKESAAPIKYLLVTEAHKSGLPHFHLLIHEQDAARPVRHKVLAAQWQLGFSRFNLVDESPNVAGYVTKYISKSNLGRVRASIAYGR